jgi:hypothetical protein
MFYFSMHIMFYGVVLINRLTTSECQWVYWIYGWVLGDLISPSLFFCELFSVEYHFYDT